MRGLTFKRLILAGTALTLVMAGPLGAVAMPDTPDVLEAAVPAPSAPPLSPPTLSDIGNPAAIEAPPTTATVPAAVPRSAAPATAVPSAAPRAAAPAVVATAPATATSAAEPFDQPATVAAPEIAKPDPLAALDPADQPIAEKIRDLLTAKVDKVFANRKERTIIETFYQKRNLAPLWLDKGVQNERAKALIARVRAAAGDGLDPRDYRPPDFPAGASPDVLAEAELKLTATLITFTRHLQAGRFPYARIGKDIEVPQQPPDTAEVLAKIADSADAGKAVEFYSPPHEAYKALKAKLAELRGRSGGGVDVEQIPDGPALKVQKNPIEDPRVPLLRSRLSILGDLSDLHYDAKVAEAVKKFQKSAELSQTGTLDVRTVKELNGPPHDRQIDLIVANMERWRWLPRDLGKTHVVVNIPDYNLKVMNNGGMVWTTRVVVGKPTLQTPLLAGTMKYITINPTWNVPPSIVQNEYLPALQQDPTVLSRMGLKVEYNRDGSVHISQPPGDRNALGRIRFNFPNRFLVYQHDTPDKHLFAHEKRAYSHGCMRVQDPAKYAEVLLSLVLPKEGYTQERIRRMYASTEHDIHFPNFVPVYLTYQSAFVDDAGKLQIRPDIYGIDNRVMAAIKSDRGMVEMAQERPKEQVSSGVKRARVQQPAPQQPQRTISFFENIFGTQQPPPPQRPVPPTRVR